MTTPRPTIAQKPTTARVRVLLLVLLATGITYLDRVCLSAAAPSITRDLGLSTIQMGFVFSVFAEDPKSNKTAPADLYELKLHDFARP